MGSISEKMRRYTMKPNRSKHLDDIKLFRQSWSPTIQDTGSDAMSSVIDSNSNKSTKKESK